MTSSSLGRSSRAARRKVSPDAGTLFGKAQKWQSQPHVYHKETLVAIYVGTNSKVTEPLEART